MNSPYLYVHANKVLKTIEIDCDLTTCSFDHRPQVNGVLPLLIARQIHYLGTI